MLRTKPAFGPALRTAFAISAEARTLTKLEAGVLMAIAYFQPITRADLTEMFGREISRDLIASLREKRLVGAGPRSPTLGAPIAYVTTERFLSEFGFESLGDLPDLEALKDAGLIDEPELKSSGHKLVVASAHQAATGVLPLPPLPARTSTSRGLAPGVCGITLAAIGKKVILIYNC